MAFTLQDVYNSCYGIIAQSQDATAYPTSLLLTFINKAQSDICYGNVVNLQNPTEKIDKQALTFLEKNQFYTTHNYQTLAVDSVVGATTLTCTNTFASSGYLWINGAIISYSANNGTTISGIPTTGQYSIPFAFVGGTQVFQLDVVPTDFGQVSRAFLTMQTSKYRTALVSVDDRDLANPIPNSYIYRFFFDRGYSNGSGIGQQWYYSLIRGSFILFLVPQTNNQPISFEYQKSVPVLSAVTDTLTIPDTYALNTIPYLAVSEMLANRGEMQEAIRLNNFGFRNVQNMYQFYATQRNELMYGQRVGTSSDGFLNF